MNTGLIRSPDLSTPEAAPLEALRRLQEVDGIEEEVANQWTEAIYQERVLLSEKLDQMRGSH